MNRFFSDRSRDRVSSPVPPFAVAVAVSSLLLVGGAPAVEGQTLRGDVLRTGVGELWIDSRPFLESVTSFDFGERAGAQPDRAPAALSASLGASGRLATRFSAPPTGDPITVVRREIDSLWRLKTRGSDPLAFTRVDYDVIGANGERGVLSHVANERSVIAVRVVELPARVTDRPGGALTVEGGVMLEMDLRQASEAGRYGGTLRVTVVQL